MCRSTFSERYKRINNKIKKEVRKLKEHAQCNHMSKLLHVHKSLGSKGSHCDRSKH